MNLREDVRRCELAEQPAVHGVDRQSLGDQFRDRVVDLYPGEVGIELRRRADGQLLDLFREVAFV